MRIWIEIEDRLPYALTPVTYGDKNAGDTAFLIFDYFNAYCYNGDRAAGAMTFMMEPDKKEAEHVLAQGDITEYPEKRMVRIDEITSILAQRK